MGNRRNLPVDCIFAECNFSFEHRKKFERHLIEVHTYSEPAAKAEADEFRFRFELDEVDMVNHPPHYARFKFEPIDVLADWFPNNPLLWQVGKYIARAEHKENIVEDLKKARFYLDREIKRQEESISKQPICYLCDKVIKDKDMNKDSIILREDKIAFFHQICFQKGAKVNYVLSQNNL